MPGAVGIHAYVCVRVHPNALLRYADSRTWNRGRQFFLLFSPHPSLPSLHPRKSYPCHSDPSIAPLRGGPRSEDDHKPTKTSTRSGQKNQSKATRVHRTVMCIDTKSGVKYTRELRVQPLLQYTITTYTNERGFRNSTSFALKCVLNSRMSSLLPAPQQQTPYNPPPKTRNEGDCDIGG